MNRSNDNFASSNFVHYILIKRLDKTISPAGLWLGFLLGYLDSLWGRAQEASVLCFSLGTSRIDSIYGHLVRHRYK